MSMKFPDFDLEVGETAPGTSPPATLPVARAVLEASVALGQMAPMFYGLDVAAHSCAAYSTGT